IHVINKSFRRNVVSLATELKRARTRLVEQERSCSKEALSMQIAPMHVLTDREVPEYEIHSSELDFFNSVKISKGTFHKASWRGIDVAVKTFGEEMFTDEDKV
ncbi:hypothetical protein AALP_AAs73943U000100, partial [Arabis alpina]